MYLLCSYRSSLVPPPSHTYTLHSFPTRRSSDLTALNRIDSSNLEFVSLLRGIDDENADPKVRLRRKISVSDGPVLESLADKCRRETEIGTRISVFIVPGFAPRQASPAETVTPRGRAAAIYGSAAQC